MEEEVLLSTSWGGHDPSAQGQTSLPLRRCIHGVNLPVTQVSTIPKNYKGAIRSQA